MPTIGLASRRPPMDPRNGASPKLNTPPSEATIQYPRPVGVAATPTIGWFRWRPPLDPKKPAPPTGKMPPARATRREPGPEATPPTIGWLRATPTLTLPGARAETAAGAEAATVAGRAAARSAEAVAAPAGEADGRTASVPRTGGAARSVPRRRACLGARESEVIWTGGSLAVGGPDMARAVSGLAGDTSHGRNSRARYGTRATKVFPIFPIRLMPQTVR